jgi:hypothetical protein
MITDQKGRASSEPLHEGQSVSSGADGNRKQSVIDVAVSHDDGTSHTAVSPSLLVENALPQTPDSESNGAPPFLSPQIIQYLRSVSQESAWQSLVTGYVTFEKEGHPSGVCFLFTIFTV